MARRKPRGGMVMSDLKSLIEQHYENVSTGNIDAERELFSADVVVTEPAAGTLRGLDAFLAYERAFPAAFPDGRLELKSSIELGNTIAVEGIYSGTHTGPLVGAGGTVPATNRRVELPFAEVNEVEGGRITRHAIYYDQMVFLAQLGLMPGPS